LHLVSPVLMVWISSIYMLIKVSYFYPFLTYALTSVPLFP
jgi:hypothetical protein